jgi:hyaluronidase-like protein HylP
MRNAFISAVVAALVSASTALAVSGAFTHVDVVSTDTTTSALGVRGHEAGRGTVKATHEPSAPGALDPNASVLSLTIAGEGTASQGLFLDAPLGTTGKLLNIRNRGREVLVLRPDGRLELHGRLVTLP